MISSRNSDSIQRQSFYKQVINRQIVNIYIYFIDNMI